MSHRNASFIVDKDGRKTAVVLAIEDYEELLKDLHDLAVIAERRYDPQFTIADLEERLLKDVT